MLHIHYLLELNLLIQGRAVAVYENTRYPMRRGDIFISRPSEPHFHYHQSGSSAAKSINELLIVLFNPAIFQGSPFESQLLSPFYLQPGLHKPYINYNAPGARVIAGAMASLEPLNKTPENQIHMFGILTNILIGISHHYPSASRPSRGILKALNFIHAQGGTSVDFSDLLRVAGMKRSQFYNNFKVWTRLSPNEYILKRRLELAQKHIITTTRSVQDIARDLDFENIGYFHRLFKKRTGQTPLEYRKSKRKLNINKPPV